MATARTSARSDVSSAPLPSCTAASVADFRAEQVRGDGLPRVEAVEQPGVAGPIGAVVIVSALVELQAGQ